MPFEISQYHQLLKPLDRREINRAVALHRGDHGVGRGPGGWTCQRHLKALLFAQVTGLHSLREIEQALAAQPKGLYHLDLRAPRRSTLSDALAQRPSEVFRDICVSLMGQVSRAVRNKAGGSALIQLVDASPIPLWDSRYDWAEADARTRGLKLHAGYDRCAGMPAWLDVTSPKVSDVTAARDGMPITAGAIYVFDKGYVDYGWWQRLHDQGARFVTRLKKNAKRRDVVPRQAEGEGILEDNELRIGHARPRGGATNPMFDTPLREILVEREGKAPLHLITNDLESSAETIAALYKQRWQVELFFKWLKQNLGIKRFLGRSENAVKTQIYVALIAFLLIHMLRQLFGKAFTGSTKTLVARLKVAPFQRFAPNRRQTPLPVRPNNLPPAPQFSLDLRPC